MKRINLGVAAAVLAAVFSINAHAADGDGLTSHEQIVSGTTTYPVVIEQSIERLLSKPRAARPDVTVDTAIAFGRIGTA